MANKKQDHEAQNDYEVGYGRPPKNNQFKKGVSGNPKGRPKRPANFREQFLREARLPVAITENGRTVRIPKYDVAIRQLTHRAMKGEPNASKLFMQLYREASEQACLLAEQQAKSSKVINLETVRRMTIEELEIAIAELDRCESAQTDRDSIAKD